ISADDISNLASDLSTRQDMVDKSTPTTEKVSLEDLQGDSVQLTPSVELDKEGMNSINRLKAFVNEVSNRIDLISNDDLGDKAQRLGELKSKLESLENVLNELSEGKYDAESIGRLLEDSASIGKLVSSEIDKLKEIS